MAPDDSLKTRLRDVGLRATRARLAVLGHLQGQDGPRSHAEVVTALASDGWDRATLYRNLNDLAAAGLVRRMDVDHVWRFELSSRADASGHSHGHFVCTDCGDVQCLPTLDIRGSTESIPVLQRHHELQIRGVCDGCV
ncbi:MAG: Fur family transcriptional regulator [Myxococcota bacterium]